MAEFLAMEFLHHAVVREDKHEPYTCAVCNNPILECLDISSPGVLANTAPNNYVATPDLFSTVTNMVEINTHNFRHPYTQINASKTNLFGGYETCFSKQVGDGAINVYDIATLLWYQFKSEPYHTLNNDPSLVVTVQGRHDTCQRCATAHHDSTAKPSRYEYSMALGGSYCNAGVRSTETTGRRLSESASRADALAAMVPAHRRMSLEVHLWATVANAGSWYIIATNTTYHAMELFLAGVSSDSSVPLSNEMPPTYGCTSCLPQLYDHSEVTVAFRRHIERLGSGADASDCASIVGGISQMTALIGNTLSLRQVPVQSSCAFDVLVWVPDDDIASSSTHVSRRRLGAEGDFAVLAGSSGANGIEGEVLIAHSGAEDTTFPPKSPPPPPGISPPPQYPSGHDSPSSPPPSSKPSPPPPHPPLPLYPSPARPPPFVPLPLPSKLPTTEITVKVDYRYPSNWPMWSYVIFIAVLFVYFGFFDCWGFSIWNTFGYKPVGGCTAPTTIVVLKGTK